MKFLYEKEEIIYASCGECGKVLKFKRYELDDIKTGVECFCGNISDEIQGMVFDDKKSTLSSNTEDPEGVTVNPTVYQQPIPIYTGPRCPTCGSADVSRITLTSKAVGGVMFGLFSSNIRNTYKCDRCGYKW